eukprot:gene20178-39837_t
MDGAAAGMSPGVPSYGTGGRHRVLRLRYKITSSCVYLSWLPPLYSGGKDVTGYILHYTFIRKEKSVAGAVRLVERSEVITLETPETSYVIRNLPASAALKNVYIRSVTVPDMVCMDSKPLEDGLETKAASMHRQFLDEIERTEKLLEDF